MWKKKKFSPTNDYSIPIIITLIQPLLLIAVVFLVAEILHSKDELSSSLIHFFFISIFLAVILFVSLKRLSAVDRLTRLPTQQTFIKEVSFLYIFKKLPNYSAVFISLKGFKYINRMVGSSNGDLILYKYGQLLKKQLKPFELAGRLGGDHFIVLIKTKRLGGFLSFIEDVNIPIKINGIDKNFSIKSYCGIYELSENDSIHDVLGKSSDALNYLRSKGIGNYLFYTEEIATEIYKEKQISYQFSSALQNNEFKVFYQPKVNIENNQLFGCEALVRWFHEGKIISPAEFIPVLEKTGLIKQLDFYVMEQVCKDINSWKEKGLKLVPIATNFSKLHIQDIDFPEQIISILNKYCTDKNLFELELTESANFEGYSNLIRLLEIMEKNNIKTAIDDFGIGYSSLALLKNSSVKIVKIDKSFIDDIEINNGENENTLLVQNIVNTCKVLNKEVICEGIENINQKNILEKMNCMIIQGFLFDKPLPYEEFEKRLRNPSY